MIKEFCDRCGVEIIKGRSKNICFDCNNTIFDNVIFGLSGKIDMTICLKCYKEIKEFAAKTIPYRGRWGMIISKNKNKTIHNKI